MGPFPLGSERFSRRETSATWVHYPIPKRRALAHSLQMATGDIRDGSEESEPLLLEHKAALFELRENLERLKKILEIEAPAEPAVCFDVPVWRVD
jgi:hypothetical protein